MASIEGVDGGDTLYQRGREPDQEPAERLCQLDFSPRGIDEYRDAYG
jgi:hypothetical protein